MDNGDSPLLTPPPTPQATTINSSLLSLIRVIHCTITSSKHIPLRDSTLTMCLESIFTKDCLVSLYVTVSPDDEDRDETLASVRFASSATYVYKEERKGKSKAVRTMRSERVEILRARARVGEARFQGGMMGRIITEGGTSCRGCGPPRPDEDIVDVVMLHYYGGRCRRFGSEAVWTDHELLRYHQGLLRRGINARILLPDFPGHGETEGRAQSSKPEFSSFVGKGGPVETVAEVMNHFGVTDRAVLFGFDWGGGVAMAFAQKYPERAKGIIVHNASYREGTEGRDKGWVRGKKVDAIWTESIWFNKKKAVAISTFLKLKTTPKCLRGPHNNEEVVIEGRIVDMASTV